MTIRVLIADDQPVVRDGLAMLLGLIDDVEIVATAADGIEAVERARSERPDIVLMDLRMPRLEGAEATRQILASLPDTRVLVLTTYADDEFLFPALQAGARGYLTKDATAEEIEHAIRALIAGQTHLDPAVQQRLVTAVLDQTPPRQPRKRRQRRGPTSRRAHPTRGRGAQADRRRPLEPARSPTSSSSATPPSRPTSTGSSTRPAPATAPKPCATPTSTAWHDSPSALVLAGLAPRRPLLHHAGIPATMARGIGLEQLRPRSSQRRHCCLTKMGVATPKRSRLAALLLEVGGEPKQKPARDASIGDGAEASCVSLRPTKNALLGVASTFSDR